MGDILGIGSYIATAAVAGLSGYRFAVWRAAPRLEELARRVEAAEMRLYQQGQALRDLSEALRGVVRELEKLPLDAGRSAAILSARAALVER